MSDLVTTQIFSNGETGITATKMNNIVGQASIQTDFFANKPLASSAASNDQLLLLTAGGTYARTNFSTVTNTVSGSLTPAGVGQAGVMNALSGKTTDYVSGANTCIDLTSAPAITLMRLRSFNAVGNSTFEADQKLCGTASGTNGFGIDRWAVWSTGTMTLNRQQLSPAGNVMPIPGTSYSITSKVFRITLTAQQTSLGTGDNIIIVQNLEGPQFRELSNDVHSISLLVQSSVANLQFSVCLQSPDGTRSLVKLCTLGASNTWTVIQLPNIPIWSGGNFQPYPGGVGYVLIICLAAGTSKIAAAANTWQAGNVFGAPTMSNFAASPVNSTFDIAFVQHEPGPQCTTLIDKPFTQNYDECLRYYSKSYPYATIAGAANAQGHETWINLEGYLNVYGCTRYPVPMAKSPTAKVWCMDGTPNGVQLVPVGTNWGVNSIIGSERGINYMTYSAAIATTNVRWSVFHYTADTGW